MKILNKFIINRNNQEYFYTEKIFGYDDIQYIVCTSKGELAYTPASFYETFGTDEKMPIIKFINIAEQNIITSDTPDERAPFIIDSLDKTKERIADKSLTNPSLWGYKSTFVTAIRLYNELIAEKEKDIEQDYEEEYERLINLLNKEKEYIRVKQDVA